MKRHRPEAGKLLRFETDQTIVIVDVVLDRALVIKKCPLEAWSIKVHELLTALHTVSLGG
jgi:hypothetical protein